MCPSGVLLHGSPLRIHSHREAFSGASDIFFIARLQSWPLTPRSLSVRVNDCPAKPRQPTSTGSQRAFQPPLLHSSTPPPALHTWLSCAHLPPPIGLPRSTWRCQSLALARSPPGERGCCCVFSPALTKKIVCLEGCWLLLLWIAVMIESAKALRTWSWRQQYRPSPKAFGQQLRICSSVPLLWHSWHAGESTKPQRCRLDGLGRRSYTWWGTWCAVVQSSTTLPRWSSAARRSPT